MPYTIQKNGEKHCVHKQMEDGSVGEKLKCYDDEAEAKDYLKALYANVPDASKAETLTPAPEYNNFAVKAVGDWELDVLAIPFGSMDSDNQYFDENTDIMPDTFKSPLIVYYHGINPDRQGHQASPEVIGKALSMEKMSDGWHVRVLLDKAKNLAGRIWNAAKGGLAAASSGSIAHLARLNDGQPYSKNKPGRIAVWPFAELSLIDIGEGRNPANPYAVALPALKAIYEQAGITLPEIADEAENDEQESRKAAKIARKNLQKRARLLMTTFDK